jgi:PPP family 3-phenylpropionic acid transporter
MGFILGVATLFAGPLFDAFGARGYLAMAAMAVLGLAGALTLHRRTGRTQIS